MGSFGPWQRRIFLTTCLISFGNALPTMCQNFVLFVPELRCRVDICEVSEEGDLFEADFATFAIPYWESDNGELSSNELEMKRCYFFETIEGSGDNATCTEDNFENSTDQTCDGDIDRKIHTDYSYKKTFRLILISISISMYY